MRAPSKLLALLLGTTAALLVPAPARAERIYLRNGQTIDGWIVEETADHLVLEVVRDATVGKIELAAAEIDRIDRERTESLEEALVRAKAAKAAAPPPRPPAPPSAPPGRPPPPRKTAAELIPKPTPQQEVAIQADIDKLGTPRRRRGSVSPEREAALADLIRMGPVVIPYVAQVLGDDSVLRRWGAAAVLENVAHAERHVEAYVDAIPGLLNLLADAGTAESPRVRATAAGALRAISGAKIDWPRGARLPDLSFDEIAASQKWQDWWARTRPQLVDAK
jgi:hypothetical protein